MDYTLGFTKSRERIEISGPSDALRVLKDFCDLPREVMVVLHLNADLTLKGIQKAAIGSRQACVFDVGDIFSLAIVQGSDAIVIAHNHPDERQAIPTDEDWNVARRLEHVGRVARRPLLDSIVLGPTSYYSMREHMDDKRKRPKIFRGGRSYCIPPSPKKLSSANKGEVLKMVKAIKGTFVVR